MRFLAIALLAAAVLPATASAAPRCRLHGYATTFAQGRVRVLVDRRHHTVAACDARYGRVIRERGVGYGGVSNSAGPWVGVNVRRLGGRGGGLSRFNVQTGAHLASDLGVEPFGFSRLYVARSGALVREYNGRAVYASVAPRLSRRARLLGSGLISRSLKLMTVHGTGQGVLYWRTYAGVTQTATVARAHGTGIPRVIRTRETGRCHRAGYRLVYASGPVHILARRFGGLALCNARTGAAARLRGVRLGWVGNAIGPKVAMSLRRGATGQQLVTYNVRTGRLNVLRSAAGRETFADALVTRRGSGVYTDGAYEPKLYYRQPGGRGRVISTDVRPGTVALTTLRNPRQTIVYWRGADGTARSAFLEVGRGA